MTDMPAVTAPAIALRHACLLAMASRTAHTLDTLTPTPAAPGDNELANLSCVQPLQRLPKLRSLAVHGNPVCLGPMYRPHILVHLPELLFLDDLRILPADIQMARESMQVQQGLPLHLPIFHAVTMYPCSAKNIRFAARTTLLL